MYIYVHTYPYIHTYIRIHILTHTHTHTYVYTHTHTHTHTHTSLASITCPAAVVYADDGMWRKAQLFRLPFFKPPLFTVSWAFSVSLSPATSLPPLPPATLSLSLSSKSTKELSCIVERV